MHCNNMPRGLNCRDCRALQFITCMKPKTIGERSYLQSQLRYETTQFYRQMVWYLLLTLKVFYSLIFLTYYDMKAETIGGKSYIEPLDISKPYNRIIITRYIVGFLGTSSPRFLCLCKILAIIGCGVRLFI